MERRTQHMPAHDEALWRRLRVLPFDFVVAEEDRDPDLRERLKEPEHARAVMSWVVEGLRLGFKDERPKVVDEAGVAYQADQNPAHDWVEDSELMPTAPDSEGFTAIALLFSLPTTSVSGRMRN